MFYENHGKDGKDLKMLLFEVCLVLRTITLVGVHGGFNLLQEICTCCVQTDMNIHRNTYHVSELRLYALEFHKKKISFQGLETGKASFRPLFLRVWDSNTQPNLCFNSFSEFKHQKKVARPNRFCFPKGLFFQPGGLRSSSANQVTASFFTTFSSNMNSLLCSSSCKRDLKEPSLLTSSHLGP